MRVQLMNETKNKSFDKFKRDYNSKCYQLRQDLKEFMENAQQKAGQLCEDMRTEFKPFA